MGNICRSFTTSVRSSKVFRALARPSYDMQASTTRPAARRPGTGGSLPKDLEATDAKMPKRMVEPDL